MKPFYVYALLDPRKENKIFYIGKGTWQESVKFKNRYYRHLRLADEGKKGPLYTKIRKIIRLGFRVGFLVLSQWEQETDAFAEEKRMIAEIGIMNLTNQTEGGEGPCHSEESKKRMSLAQTGRITSEATKRKISIANKGKIKSEEVCKEISERMKGHKPTIETREKLRQAGFGNKRALGYHHTEEARRKIADANKGKILSEETKKRIAAGERGKFPTMLGKHHTEEAKRKMSKAKKGRKMSLEQRGKLSITLTGRAFSPEHCKHLSEAVKLIWQRRHLEQAREKLLVVLQQIAA